QPRVENAARTLGIGELMKRKPRELSGGQRQRVALGRAIVREPDVFLLDEPLSNLDARLRVQMRVELAELQRRLGTTMVYVTHDQEEAMTLGHRIVVMRDGVIQQADTPAVVYNTPKNAFVARFIGSPPMNLISGALAERGKSVVFAVEDGAREIALPPVWERPLRAHVGRLMFLGIRPENISSAGDYGSAAAARLDLHASEAAVDPEGSDIRLNVEAAAVEMLGPQKLVYFHLGGELAVASLAPDHPARAGETVETVWNGKRLHLFDGQSEERLEITPQQVGAA
ncbi:MAG TPA: ATP-binding cassette domain-containing protein, partial [Trueperaceae bacterium]|nr:ATP-binding cassette domain-containing protein [Trueperaceae bacterium]